MIVRHAAWAALVAALVAAGCGGGRSEPDGSRAAAKGAPAHGAAPGGSASEASASRTPGATTDGARAGAADGAARPGNGQQAPAATAEAAHEMEPPAAAPTEPNHREVALFFQRAEDDSLGPERRKILLTPSVVDQAKQIVGELVVGPETEGLLPTVPRRTTVLGVYLDRAGTIYVDLSEEFVSGHPGGSSEELATIFSIVDSLTYNLPEIRRVRFLVGGEERDTLKNHLDLRSAYLKDMSIVRMEEGG